MKDLVSEHFIGIVLPFCAAGTLQDLLRLRARCDPPRSFSEKSVWRILYQIAAALRALHEFGFAHGDLKPSNVLMRRDLQLYVADLGSAVKLGQRRNSRQTLAYMPPETCKGAHTAHHTSSDMWSLGCIAYELVSLQHPFVERTQLSATSAPNASKVIKIIRNFDPRTLGDAFSPSLRAVVFSLLEKDPARRLTLDEFFAATPPAIAKQFHSDNPLHSAPAAVDSSYSSAGTSPFLGATAPPSGSATGACLPPRLMTRKLQSHGVVNPQAKFLADGSGLGATARLRTSGSAARRRTASDTTFDKTPKLRHTKSNLGQSPTLVTLTMLRQTSRLARSNSMGCD